MNVRQKIGVVSCSGECCRLGTLSRVATRMVLEEREDTVTICLPLFLAGDAGEREFARIHPTVAVDGCGKLCALRGIEKHSGRVAASVNVEELLERWGLDSSGPRRELDEEGKQAAGRVAEVISRKVEKLAEGTP